MLHGPDGQIVYRNDPTNAETTVARGTQLPARSGPFDPEITAEAD
jgi:hypothetical protein